MHIPIYIDSAAAAQATSCAETSVQLTHTVCLHLSRCWPHQEGSGEDDEAVLDNQAWLVQLGVIHCHCPHLSSTSSLYTLAQSTLHTLQVQVTIHTGTEHTAHTSSTRNYTHWHRAHSTHFKYKKQKNHKNVHNRTIIAGRQRFLSNHMAVVLSGVRGRDTVLCMASVIPTRE